MRRALRSGACVIARSDHRVGQVCQGVGARALEKVHKGRALTLGAFDDGLELIREQCGAGARRRSLWIAWVMLQSWSTERRQSGEVEAFPSRGGQEGWMSARNAFRPSERLRE